MTEETKEALQLVLELLKTTLRDTGTYIGVLVDKEKPHCSEIVFLDKQAYLNGQNKGFKVELAELNGFKEKKKMTREEKIKKNVNKCRRTSHCGNCKLYGHYSVCPVDLYLKDGTPMADWSVNRAYEILFENEETRKEFTQADLETGMVVETRDENRYFVLEQEGRIKVIDMDGSCLSEIYDDLTADKKEDDIMVVYQAPAFDDVTEIADLYMKNGYVLWERQEPREMTLEEVEKELGYKIKIVGKCENR